MQPRCSSQMIWRGRVLGHRLDRVLVAQVVRALDAVEGVVLGRVLFAVAERGVDAALGRARMAADRVHFRDDRDVGAALGGLDRGAHAGEAAADDDDVVLDHYLDAPRHSSETDCAAVYHQCEAGRLDFRRTPVRAHAESSGTWRRGAVTDRKDSVRSDSG